MSRSPGKTLCTAQLFCFDFFLVFFWCNWCSRGENIEQQKTHMFLYKGMYLVPNKNRKETCFIYDNQKIPILH